MSNKKDVQPKTCVCGHCKKPQPLSKFFVEKPKPKIDLCNNCAQKCMKCGEVHLTEARWSLCQECKKSRAYIDAGFYEDPYPVHLQTA